MRSIVLAAAALCLMTAAAGARPAVTPRQMVTWTIVCEASATPAERTAATEFQTLFRGLTGRTLRIAPRASRSGSIFIGPDAVRRSGRRMPSVALGEEGLRIRVDRDAVCIDGGRPRGTLYGVHEFFEELCGVRYLTFDHTYFPPRAASASIPAGSRAYVPQFAFRWSYYGETNRNPAFAARLHTNTIGDDPKLGGRTGYHLVGHNVTGLVPPAKYGKDHPEYFALVNGERAWRSQDPQLCTTNPDLPAIITRAIEEQIRQDPAQRNFSIAQNDSQEYCTCPKCAAVDRREGSHSGSLIALVNAVAERIEKRHPNVLISTYAYEYTRKPPRTIRPRRNVMIQLCTIECCALHAIDEPTCPLNRAICRDAEAWKAKCDKVFVWHYNTNFQCYMLPFPNLRAIGRSVRYFADHSGRGVFMQAAGNGFSTEMSDLRNYVMSRCLWKPGRDSWREAMEFCRLHYAESAAPIMAYLAYYHDLVQSSGGHPNCGPTEAAICITPASARRTMRYFREALARARSAEVRGRVEKASLCAYRAALSAASLQLTFADGVCRPTVTGLDPDPLGRYEALVKKYGVTMENELVQVAPYIDGLRTLYAGLAAVPLENATWRLMLLPGSNGKLVDMTYKPTGRNVIQPHRAFSRFRYEEWVRSGAGPGPQRFLAYDVVERRPDRVKLALTAEDGSQFERTISLIGDAVRFETTVTAGPARSIDLWVHPEYDTGTTSPDARVLGVYVKRDGAWVAANRGWVDAKANPTQEACVREAAPGGAFAFYNHRAGFGIEQRFDPQAYRELAMFWFPVRSQLNLEMMPAVRSLEAGAAAHYGYEVRYLANAPHSAGSAPGQP